MQPPKEAPVHAENGGDSGGATPLPIPNREVKPASADGTRRATSRESRTPPVFLSKGPPQGRPFSLRRRPRRRGASRATRSRARGGVRLARRSADGWRTSQRGRRARTG